MRVALLSRNCCRADAIGAQVVAKIAYFQQLGAEVRLYLSEAQSLRAEAASLKPVVGTSHRIWQDASERDYLLSCDLVVAELRLGHQRAVALDHLEELAEQEDRAEHPEAHQ